MIIPKAEVHDVIVVEIAIHVPNRMTVIVIRGQSLVNGAVTETIQEWIKTAKTLTSQRPQQKRLLQQQQMPVKSCHSLVECQFSKSKLQV